MQFSEAQRAQITSWLETRMLSTNCLMCGDMAWKFSSILCELTATAEADENNSETADPMIQAVCTNCGYVRFFSARVIGLVP